MNAIRKYLDKIKPNFQKGGKLEYLHSTFDAFETFLFVPNKTTFSGSHIRDYMDMKRTMSMVVLALIPILLFGMWNVGYQHFIANSVESGFWANMLFGARKVLPILIVSYVVGLGIEFAFAQIRGHEVNEGFLVTGFLIPLIVPPDIPLWMVALATAFAVIFGKEVFGGTGMNILNPALTARAFLFFAYPQDMSGEKVWVADALSGATPLGKLMVNEPLASLPSPSDMFFGFIPGSVGETSTLLILLGGLFLIYTGIASWKIIISVFAGGYALALLFNFLGPIIAPENVYMAMPAYYHLVIGGFAFGAVYMATDPVTAAQTNRGKWIYGLLIGILAVLIRVLNPAYPEGMMLAILLMNVFAPLIDYYVVRANINKRLKRFQKTQLATT
ncbi:MAG: NADH:ubiquinone reductase (Na(+)-transporting) subunit B [Bacteroidales bacterium]|jgi:Na+-transporting NADH:ubiquinone oxidoreductase subunit B|nr:NADH:ubiquinone reductase (Na(+)-transporting) subunit B [Bacteroidales bacterium]MDI9593196.1 NADH:ubiquinone reductase (Na(+)-transporting) subunit B [Bacteroidota bacterium]OQC37865.1 MAG: Na(+)-translocating NADH-quinone reductase subunit B [Bacteroidetes bacterium ADurb.Bin041]HNV50756.1 NADH:ubiquinone reductase (Na(+)-transporting) subunit B [Bacteroidales bacterium]HOF81497.1 NADH:ubiquinone reductase (Na(+)-transporting) subunit B [Bacteroidales bacterium]